MEEVTSRRNPLAVHIRRLGSERKYRRACGSFLCEGDKLVEEALRWGAEVETLVCTRGSEPPAGLPEGTRLVQVPEELMESLSTVETPQRMLCVCRTPERTLPEPLPVGSYLVLDGLQDPGNVGTIWRTADALGADGLILVNGCADPFAPKTVRATMGACFRLPVYELEAEELPGLLERSGLPLYATALRADTVDLRRAELSRCAVVIGSEGRGVSPGLLSGSRMTLKIPMRSRCESLNAAAAAAIVLWEIFRSE